MKSLLPIVKNSSVRMANQTPSGKNLNSSKSFKIDIGEYNDDLKLIEEKIEEYKEDTPQNEVGELKKNKKRDFVMKSISGIPRIINRKKKMEAAELFYSPYLNNINPLIIKSKMRVLKKKELKQKKSRHS